MIKRVSFLIDGFNVYHSLDELQKMTGKSVKWLDLRALCARYIQRVKTEVGSDHPVEIAHVHYFSAIAEHMRATKPDVPLRHETYIAALKETGVQVSLAQFKRKTVTCPMCKKPYIRHEEKETDQAIGVKLIEVFARSECDAAVIVSGDTDLLPAMRTAKKLFAARKIGIGFPFNRRNNEPQNYADFYFSITQKDIERSQLPNPVKAADGRVLEKPRSW